MVHVCLLRTPKWYGDFGVGLKGVAITTNNPLCLIRLHVVSTQETQCHTIKSSHHSNLTGVAQATSIMRTGFPPSKC